MAARIVCLGIIISFLFINIGICATIGDSIEPIGDKRFAIAGEQNLVFSREIDYGPFQQADLKDAYQWYAKGTYGISERVNIYAKGGVSDLEHKFRDGTNDFDIEYDLGPLWGVGVLAAMPRWKGLNLGIDLQYAGWYVEVESLKYNQERSSEDVGEVLVTELQGTLFASYLIEFAHNARFIPYVGLTYLYLNNETQETITYTTLQRSGTIDFDLNNSRDLHFIVGGDFQAGENVSITLEGTVMYDNRGAMLGVSYLL